MATSSSRSPNNGKIVAYLVDDVDEGLGVALFERPDHIDRLLAREDCLDNQGEFTLGDVTADQTLQCPFPRVQNKGWFRGFPNIPWWRRHG